MTRRLLLVLLGLAVLAATGLGVARAVAEPPRTPHEVAAAVERTLRCPTCQGLSIADSPSSIAAGMRRIVEKKAAAGRSPEEIRNYFVARYGEWVLLAPPRRGVNWALWLLPGVAVAAGLVLAVRASRRRASPHTGVDDAALARAEETYAAYRSGEFTPRASEERVEAALELLASIDEDRERGATATATREETMRRLAAGLAAGSADGPVETSEAEDTANTETTGNTEDAEEADTATDPAPEQRPDTPRAAGAAQPRPARRALKPLAYTAGGAVFGVALAGLLLANTGDRGAGEVITGSGGASPAPSATGSPNVAALRAQVRENSADPAAWLALGLTLDRQGRIGRAYQAYQRVLDLDPANTVARQRAGWALIRGGEPAEAIPLLERATRRDPRNARSVFLLGLAQYGADRPEAAATLRRYLKLAPDGPMSTRVRALLEKT